MVQLGNNLNEGLSGPVLLNEKQKGTAFKMQNNSNNLSNGVMKASSFSNSRPQGTSFPIFKIVTGKVQWAQVKTVSLLPLKANGLPTAQVMAETSEDCHAKVLLLGPLMGTGDWREWCCPFVNTIYSKRVCLSCSWLRTGYFQARGSFRLRGSTAECYRKTHLFLKSEISLNMTA